MSNNPSYIAVFGLNQPIGLLTMAGSTPLMSYYAKYPNTTTPTPPKPIDWSNLSLANAEIAETNQALLHPHSQRESPNTPLQFPILSILIQQMVVALAEKRPFAPNKEI